MTRLLIILFVLTAAANGQDAVNPIPSLREQVRIHQEWLRTRVDSILPRIMREHGVQMWIIPMREYNEDPVFSSLVSLTTFAARRRTIYVFHDRGPALGVEKLALGGSSQGGVYIAYRDSSLGNNAELWGKEQWSLLAKVVRERDPETIAVNISHTHAFSDGLSAGEWEQLSEALGEYSMRIVRRERLALDFISLRIPEMLPTYREMMKAVHAIISTAFSSEVIVPGKTRTQDVVWTFRG
jgi:hypothetical protein